MSTENNFILNSSGDFGTDGNWFLDHVPENTEDAEINSNGGIAVDTEVEFVNSIGTTSGDGVVISGGQLTAYNGTGPNANDGSISIVDGFLFLGNGTFDNPGIVDLAGVNSSDVGTFDVEGSITLDGGGNIEAAIVSGGRPGDNIIGGFNFTTTPTLVNKDNTISGDLTIGGLNFINDGSIQTNNDSSSSGGEIAIQGSAGGGSFTNTSNGGIFINSGGLLVIGENNKASTIDNEGSIFFQADLQFTQLFVTGNVTISASGGGRIQMFGQTPNHNEIDDLGEPTQLNLVNQTLDGAGTIGIGDNTLTLNLESGTIEADLQNQVILINTGSNSITNGGTLQAILGGDLVIDSPITNLGTINVAGDGSMVDLFGAVSGTGSIDIGSGGVLDVNASVAGNFSFTGVNALIKLESTGSLQGTIAGAQGTDFIDLTSVAFASGDRAVWQQNGSTGTLSLVNGGGTTLAAFTLSGQYSSADFSAGSDGSGGTLLEVLNPPPPTTTTTADTILRDASGDYEIFDLGGNAILAAYALGQAASQWRVAGLGGFNGSDTSDMMLRDSATGALQVEDVSNNNITDTVAMGQVGLEWSVAGFGDFSSRASETDMLMRNSDTGAFEIYDISNNAITSAASMGQVGLEWSVAGFGDFSTRPNETDMLMRNNNTGAFEIYDISNNQLTSFASMGQVGLEWSVVGFGDFSGNANENDMLMRNTNTGAFEIYDITRNTLGSFASMGQVGLEWQIVGFGPINGAGSSDMLMRNVNTGAFEIYDITNNQLTTAASMGAVGLEWSVAGITADPPSGMAAAGGQLAQAMASFASSGGAPDNSSPLGQAAAQPNASSLLGAPTAQAQPT